jgi:hypothetical protein
MTEADVPEGLREEVRRTLGPVRRLPAPWVRALLLLPVAALLLAVVPRVWNLRPDAADVGPWRLWVGSALQIGVGLALIASALRESIPGRLSAPRTLAAWAALGLGFMLMLTAATFIASPTHVPPRLEWIYFRTCVTRSFGLGLLPLGVAGLLLRRGLVARPMAAGALAGLGAGLLADSNWRLFCEVSDPIHVLTAHAGAIVAVMAAGALAGRALGWAQLRRDSWRLP